MKTFSEKLGADVEAWQKAMNAELQSAIAKVKEQMRVNHEQVTKMADDVASMRQAANLGGTATTAAGAAADVAALGKRLKAVEESVKTFSSKLGTDVEAWQQAINTELQSALSKVKEQVFKNADAVQKVAHDVEGLAGGKPPEGGDGAAAAAGAKGPHDAAAQAALQKRVKVLEATLAAHEMALQAHTETLEAHATWLECVGAPARLPARPPRPGASRSPPPPRPPPLYSPPKQTHTLPHVNARYAEPWSRMWRPSKRRGLRRQRRRRQPQKNRVMGGQQNFFSYLLRVSPHYLPRQCPPPRRRVSLGHACAAGGVKETSSFFVVRAVPSPCSAFLRGCPRPHITPAA